MAKAETRRSSRADRQARSRRPASQRATLIGLGLNKISRVDARGHAAVRGHDRQGRASRPHRRRRDRTSAGWTRGDEAQRTSLTMPGAPQVAQARRPRHRLGQGQDRRARRQGPEGALRRAPSTGFEGGQMPLHRRLPKRGFNNVFAQELQRDQSRAAAGRRSMPGSSTPGKPIDAAALVAAGVMPARQGRRAAARQGRAQGEARR